MKRSRDPFENAALIGKMATGELPNDASEMGLSPLLELAKKQEKRRSVLRNSLHDSKMTPHEEAQ